MQAGEGFGSSVVLADADASCRRPRKEELVFWNMCRVGSTCMVEVGGVTVCGIR